MARTTVHDDGKGAFAKILDGFVERFKASAADPTKIDKIAREFRDEFGETAEMGTSPGDTHVHIHGNPGEGNAEKPGQGFVSDEDFQAHVRKNDDEHKVMADGIAELRGKFDGLKPPDNEEIPGEVADEMEAEANEGEETKARTAHDSAPLSSSWQATAAGAEVLSPGIAMPAYVRDAKPNNTLIVMCKTRSMALDAAYRTAAGKAIIDEITRGRPPKLDGSAPCGQIRTLFFAAVAAAKAVNSGATRVYAADGTTIVDPTHKAPPKVPTNSELNKAARERWSRKIRVGDVGGQ